eukprot:13227332-Ditylum_brightwellii.AAC.1
MSDNIICNSYNKSMTINASSIEDIWADFVYQILNRIVEQPTYKDIAHLQQQLIRNAVMLESSLGGGQNGLSSLAEFPPMYTVGV